MKPFRELSFLSASLVVFAFIVCLFSIGYTVVHGQTATSSCCLLGGAPGSTAGAVKLDNSAVIDETVNPPVFHVVGAIAPGTAGYLVHNQPTCGAATYGNLATFLSATQTWGATITEGSTYQVLGFCDGTNWTVAGK